MARSQCAAEEGLVAAAYERRYAQHSRVCQMAKLHLFGASSGEAAAAAQLCTPAALCPLRQALPACASSTACGTHRAALHAGLFNCPLAMTDGAARLCQVLLARRGGGDELVLELQAAYNHLTSRDPAHFWTSGQARRAVVARQRLQGCP
jgi:hypothetical protein